MTAHCSYLYSHSFRICYLFNLNNGFILSCIPTNVHGSVTNISVTKTFVNLVRCFSLVFPMKTFIYKFTNRQVHESLYCHYQNISRKCH